MAGNRDNSPHKYLISGNGERLGSKERKRLLNVYANLRLERPGASVKEIATCAAKLFGVSVTTVFQCKKEFNQSDGKVVTPGKKRHYQPGNSGKRLEVYDEFTLSALRRKMHDFYRQNLPPTTQKLSDALKDDPELPNISRMTVCRLLNDLGFEHKRRKRNLSFIEREDIQLWRRRYLRNMKSARRDGKTIYYLDETWINAGATVSSAWQDTTIKSAKQPFLAGLTTGLKAPTGKGIFIYLYVYFCLGL